MADYPQYEIKIIYRCDLCDVEHTAIARAKGHRLAQEIGTGVGKARASCMVIAKKGIVEEFLKAHPKATASDFHEKTLLAEEVTVHDEKTTEKEQVGVPVTAEEIVGYFEQIKGASALEAKEQDQKLTSVEAEELSPLNTGSPSMSFDEVCEKATEMLDSLLEEEKKLSERLEIIQSEIRRFRTLLSHDLTDSE